MNILFER